MRFNFFKAKEQATSNHEGPLAWKMDAKAELYAAVVTASLNDTFYEKANAPLQRIKKLNRLSKKVQKGIALAFNKFDEYQFAKYNRAAEVKLRDALFLAHPKAKDAQQQDLFNKIVNNTLVTPYTWGTGVLSLESESVDPRL